MFFLPLIAKNARLLLTVFVFGFFLLSLWYYNHNNCKFSIIKKKQHSKFMIQKLNNSLEVTTNKEDILNRHKRLFLFSKISTISRIILFVLLTIYFKDWRFIFCILFSYYGGIFSEFGKFPLLITLSLAILYSFLFGFVWNSYFSLFFFSYLYGYILFSFGTSFRRKLENKKFTISKPQSQFFD